MTATERHTALRPAMALKDPARAGSDVGGGGFWAYDAFANAAASHQDSKLAREPPEISRNASHHVRGDTMLIRGVGLAKVAPQKWRQEAGAVDEIATVFMEAAPHLMSEDGSHSGDVASNSGSAPSPPRTPPGVSADDRTASFRSQWSSFRSTLSGTGGPSPFAGRLRSRLRRCTPARVDRALDWTTLRCVIRSESVAEEKLAEESRALGDELGGAVDINSGGAVFFCVFDGAEESEETREPPETVAVVKFCANRLAAQSEYFAYEIAASLGVVAPTTRLFRKAALGVENTPPVNKGDFPGAPVPPADGREWSAALDAARRLSFPVVVSREEAEPFCSDEAATADVREDAEAVREDADAAEALARCLEGNQAGLVMRYVRGKPLVPDDLRRALSPDSKHAEDNARALGRVFVLDMLLANPDRLPCSRLMWRGNPGNLLYGRAGTGDGDGAAVKGGEKSVVVIDQAVPRRPPAMRARQDAKEVPPLTELLRNHSPTAREVFIESLGGAESLEAAGLDPNEVADGLTDSFRRGVEDAVDAAAKLKGLFDSLARGLYETLKMLFEDLDDMQKEARSARIGGAPDAPPADPSPVKVLLEERRAAAASSAADASPPRKQAAQVKALDFPGVGGGAMVPKTLARASSGSPRLPGGVEQHPPTGLAARPENNAGLGDVDKLVGGGIETPNAKSSSSADAAPAPLARQGTMKLRKAQKEAKGSEAMGEWLVDWEDVMRDDKAQLKVRCGEWAARRGLNADMHTGFLDCSTGRDIVDCYELWVRLSHLIHRGAGIVQASETRCASEVGNRLFLGGALAANAAHTLKALGVTHVLNCTDDLEDAHVGSFEYHRLPAKDVAEENLSVHFEGANAFIRGALSDPANSVLVHCFEGKSRSATIVAQYLMESTRANLSDTLKGMKAAHPDTKPNEGFMRLLMAKEKALFGLEESSVSEKKVRGRGKPQMRSCPKCGARCGLSAESVKLHIKKAHPTMGM